MNNKSYKTNRRGKKNHRKYIKRKYNTRKLRGGVILLGNRGVGHSVRRSQNNFTATLKAFPSRAPKRLHRHSSRIKKSSPSTTTYLRNLTAVAKTIDPNDDLAGSLLIPFVDKFEHESISKTGGAAAGGLSPFYTGCQVQLKHYKSGGPMKPGDVGLVMAVEKDEILVDLAGVRWLYKPSELKEFKEFLPTFGFPSHAHPAAPSAADGMHQTVHLGPSHAHHAVHTPVHLGPSHAHHAVHPSPHPPVQVHPPPPPPPPLPPPWIAQFDPASGRVFYVNTQTKVSTWTPPSPSPPPPSPPPPYHSPSPPPSAEPDIVSETVKSDFTNPTEADAFVSKYALIKVGERAPCWWHKIDAYERRQLQAQCTANPFNPECVGRIEFGADRLAVTGNDRLEASMEAFSRALNAFTARTNHTTMQHATGNALTRILRHDLDTKAGRCPRASIPHRCKSPALTFCEIAAIYFFTQAEGPGSFSTYSMLRLNMQFAKVKDMTGRQYAEMLREKLVTFFFSAVSKCPKVSELRWVEGVSGHIHRFMTLPESVYKLYNDNMHQGNKVTFYCFQSFTLKLTVGSMANMMAFSSPSAEKPYLVILRISINENTTARYISHLSAIEQEEEVLALPCIPYIVEAKRAFAVADKSAAAVQRMYNIPGDVTRWQGFQGILVITLSQLPYAESMQHLALRPFNG